PPCAPLPGVPSPRRAARPGARRGCPRPSARLPDRERSRAPSRPACPHPPPRGPHSRTGERTIIAGSPHSPEPGGGYPFAPRDTPWRARPRVGHWIQMDALVTWEPAGVEAWAEVAGEGAVLMHSLRGFVDAGRAGSLMTEHVLGIDEPIRIAAFDVDRLLDYRSRRPEMVFSVNQWTDYDEPELVLDMVRDKQGRPFLLLHGVEPDILWERYIRAVKEIVKRMGV